MLAGLEAIRTKPSIVYNINVRSKRLDTLKREPTGVKMITKQLQDGKKSKKYLLENIGLCKSALEVAISYMFDKDMITKHPINPNNHRFGMEYKLCKN